VESQDISDQHRINNEIFHVLLIINAKVYSEECTEKRFGFGSVFLGASIDGQPKDYNYILQYVPERYRRQPL